MSDVYVECLIKARGKGLFRFLKVLLIMLTVVFALLSLMGVVFMFILAIAAGVGIYFVNLQCNVEYEYMYMDRELTIDKIMAKTKRKRVGVYSVDRMEIFAPVKSYHLDNFKNRSVTEKDFSIGEELKPDRRYVFYYEGGQRILVSPSEELVKAMKMIAPRKIFND